jgi:hypothetical protein
VAFFRSIQEEDEKAFESEANARIQDSHHKFEAVAWLNRCGWPRHTVVKDRGPTW